jgi:hypothetical protein
VLFRSFKTLFAISLFACTQNKIGVNNHSKSDENKMTIIIQPFIGFPENETQNIANELTSKGIITDRGKNFSKQSIQVILKNDFYTGIIRHGNVKQDGNHKALINKITFGKVINVANVSLNDKKLNDFTFIKSHNGSNEDRRSVSWE